MLLSPFERLIAFRYLRARREEGLISVIAGFSLTGIALGVATLIVVLAVMRGVREEMIESIIGLEGHVDVYSITRGIADYGAVSNRIRALPGVETAVPLIEGQVMASGHSRTMGPKAVGAMVSGIRFEDLKYKPLIAQKLIRGNLGDFRDGRGVLIGKSMAEKMGLGVGDMITLISPEGRATPAGVMPRIKAYPIAGIFNIGMYAYDNGLIVMPFEEAQVYFQLKGSGVGAQGPGGAANSLIPDPRSLIPDKASVIEVNGNDPDAAPELAREIARTLGPGFRVENWKSTNSRLFRAVDVQRNVFFMILALIILVASFNIISSLIMLVREKGQDIAILRTMGATRGSVLRIFIACGASIGVAGTAIGIALGLLIALNTLPIQHFIEHLTGQPLFNAELYFLSSLPAKVDAREVLAVAIMALALSFLATLYPAARAAKMNPAESLRYE